MQTIIRKAVVLSKMGVVSKFMVICHPISHRLAGEVHVSVAHPGTLFSGMHSVLWKHTGGRGWVEDNDFTEQVTFKLGWPVTHYL